MDHDGIVAGESGWPIGYLCHCDNVTFNRKINKKVRVIFIHYNISKSGLTYKPKFRQLTSYIGLPIPA